jgi:hypothetical protein
MGDAIDGAVLEQRLTVGVKPIEVQRVTVTLPPVDENYNRVELVIDGETYEMSGPDAQVLGQRLARAGGWEPFNG